MFHRSPIPYLQFPIPYLVTLTLALLPSAASMAQQRATEPGYVTPAPAPAPAPSAAPVVPNAPPAPYAAPTAYGAPIAHSPPGLYPISETTPGPYGTPVSYLAPVEGAAWKWGLYAGFGIMQSGNFGHDLRNYLTTAADLKLQGGTASGNVWCNLNFAAAFQVYRGLYLVPEIVMSFVTVDVVTPGMEAFPSQNAELIFQLGGGLRYYPFQWQWGTLFVQASLFRTIGESDFDGFPLNSRGLAPAFKVGVEARIARHERITFDLGYAYIPFEAPIPSASYSSTYTVATDPLGGNYGGIFGTLSASWWNGW